MHRWSDVERTREMPAPPDLERLAAAAGSLRGVRRRDVRPGDVVLVATRNSLYALAALGDGEFAASGGWFNEHPAVGGIAVNGCTWGGRAILTDMIAAPGLFLEFGNGVRTTRILAVSRAPRAADASLN